MTKPKKKRKQDLSRYDIQSKAKNTLSSLNRLSSHDVNAVILVSQNDEAAAMLSMASPKPILRGLNSLLI